MGHRFSTGNFTYGKHVEIGTHRLPICLFLIKGKPTVWKYTENPWNTYGKMMVLVLNPLAAIGIPCVFHRFPTCYQSVEINIRKTYGVPTTGQQQKFDKAHVQVPLSIPQVKNHGIAHLPLDNSCLYPPLCDPLPIISILIILIACIW